MRRKHAILAAVLLAGLAALGAPAARGETVAEKDALAIAGDFATAVGMTWGEPTEVVLKQDAGHNRDREWHIGFHDFATIGVNPSKGFISSAVDYSVSRRDYALASEHPLSQEQPQLDEETALARAGRILALAGLEDAVQLESPVLLLRQHSVAPDVYCYLCNWRLMYQGVPFDDGGVMLQLSPADGRLIVLSTGLDIPAPESVRAVVDRPTAETAAQGLCRSLDSRFRPAETEMELRIVVPNSYWADRGLGEEITEAGSRVAWVVKLREAGGHFRTFWIDAANGTLLGGTQSKGAVSDTTTTSSGSTTSAIAVDPGPKSASTGVPRSVTAMAAAAVLALAAGVLLRRRRAAAC